MIAEPAGSRVASLAIDAVTSADMPLSIASNSAASAPKSGPTTRGASRNPVQKRTASASAASQDSHAVTPGRLVAAQLDSSTLLPAPADPTRTVRRLPAPSASRVYSTDRETSVRGSVVGRNCVSANRALAEVPLRVVICCVTALPQPPLPEPQAGLSCWQSSV